MNAPRHGRRTTAFIEIQKQLSSTISTQSAKFKESESSAKPGPEVQGSQLVQQEPQNSSDFMGKFWMSLCAVSALVQYLTKKCTT